MTDISMTLLEYLRKHSLDQDSNFLQEGIRLLSEMVMDLEVSWQRCRVHFMRNLLAYVPKRDKAMVAAAVRTIFAHLEREAAGQQLIEVAAVLQKRWPKAATMLLEAEEDMLCFMHFPQSHWPADLLQQSASPVQQGQSAHQCGRHLSRPGRGHSPCWNPMMRPS